jgi:hypothetical protein
LHAKRNLGFAYVAQCIDDGGEYIIIIIIIIIIVIINKLTELYPTTNQTL